MVGVSLVRDTHKGRQAAACTAQGKHIKIRRA